jgi:hypothetical protein
MQIHANTPNVETRCFASFYISLKTKDWRTNRIYLYRKNVKFSPNGDAKHRVSTLGVFWFFCRKKTNFNPLFALLRKPRSGDTRGKAAGRTMVRLGLAMRRAGKARTEARFARVGMSDSEPVA